MKLTGNTIFIAGGGSGIGRGLAEALHKLGNKQIISGRRRANLDEAVTANPGMVAVELDITDPASIDRVAARLIAEHPDLNVLLNNAGIMLPDQAAGRINDKLLVDTGTTNVFAPIRMTAALVEHLKHKDGAVIVYTSSVLGFVPLAAFAGNHAFKRMEVRTARTHGKDDQGKRSGIRARHCARLQDRWPRVHVARGPTFIRR
jgi:uncharacterized oxidoreductase